MIKNLDLVNHIREQLTNDAPTTEIFESLDTLSEELENFDAGILFALADDGALTVTVRGDEKSKCFALAARLFDAVNKEIQEIVLQAEQRAKQLELDGVDNVSTGEE